MAVVVGSTEDIVGPKINNICLTSILEKKPLSLYIINYIFLTSI